MGDAFYPQKSSAAFDLMFCQEARDLKEAELAAEGKAALRTAAAEAEALKHLAEMHCPEDLVAFGERLGIPNLAEMMWLNGFQAGWRARHSRDGEKP